MSVEYEALYGYGFHITPNILEKLDKNKFDEFIDDSFTIAINSWVDDNDKFFGILIESIGEGSIKEVSQGEYPDKIETFKLMDRFHYYFPTEKQVPKHYIIHRVY